MERSKTSVHFWPIRDMSSSVGALWRSCLTVTELCHSTWMTWRRKTSASSSASTSWRRGYSRSMRRAAKMSTARWVKQLWLMKWMGTCVTGDEWAWKWFLFRGWGSVHKQPYYHRHWFSLMICAVHLCLYQWYQMIVSVCVILLSCVTDCLLTPLSHWPGSLLYQMCVFRYDCLLRDYTLTCFVLRNFKMMLFVCVAAVSRPVEPLLSSVCQCLILEVAYDFMPWKL